MGAAVLVFAGAGAGVGMAVTADNPSTPAAGPTTTVAPGGGKHAGKHTGAKDKVDPARQAWAHQYGLDRATMPMLADVASASPDQQAAAADLLARTQAATAQYSDLDKAKAAGFDLQASLTKDEKKRPNLAADLQRIDSGQPAKNGKMPMLHVGNKANRADGKVLDPTAPETLMYGYQGHGNWTLVGVMYTANESYPQAPPDPGGPITRWHYHDKAGGQKLMMHIFFVPGNDLAHAYATEMGG
ncbi:MAG: hypothetical protein M3063_17490 [Actinomycetota bacterium]|nr:hypothetical protein [Actinomycetota bacterium]